MRAQRARRSGALSTHWPEPVTLLAGGADTEVVRTVRPGRVVALVVVAATSLLAACTDAGRTGIPSVISTPPITNHTPGAAAPPTPAATPRPTANPTGADGVPRFDHIVVVVEENKPYGELVGTTATPFLTSLAGSGAVLTQSYAMTHPSEPNYLALFSGSTQGLTNDSCPHQFRGPNVAASLIAAGDTFTGYAESLPSPGYTGCSAGTYARKHAPWVNFTLPPATSEPMTAFPTDFAHLPNLSFVIPDLQDDMHDGSIARGDQWLTSHLSAYRKWAATHNSLLVLTTDEDDNSHANHITTILAGAHITPGHYPNRTDHYGLLHTLLDSFTLTSFAGATTTPAITRIWVS